MASTGPTFRSVPSTVGGLTRFDHNNTPAVVRTSGKRGGHYAPHVEGRAEQPLALDRLPGQPLPAGRGPFWPWRPRCTTARSIRSPPWAWLASASTAAVDGSITGSLTARLTAGTPTTVTAGAYKDVSFNGTQVTFNIVALPDLVSVSYEGSCNESETSGAGGGTDSTDEVYHTLGIPDETVTVEVLGGGHARQGRRGRAGRRLERHGHARLDVPCGSRRGP